MTEEKAVFGMGCFWSPEAFFGGLKEVIATEVGYAGGTKESPSYKALGDHTEVVIIVFDSEQISYPELVRLFFSQHKVRTSIKKQYQSLIVPQNTDQAEIAEQISAEKLGAENNLRIEGSKFWSAEDYHQKYRLRNSELFKFFDTMSEDDIRTSTLAARANAYVAGDCSKEELLKYDSEIEENHEGFRKFLEQKQF